MSHTLNPTNIREMTDWREPEGREIDEQIGGGRAMGKIDKHRWMNGSLNVIWCVIKWCGEIQRCWNGTMMARRDVGECKHHWFYWCLMSDSDSSLFVFFLSSRHGFFSLLFSLPPLTRAFLWVGWNQQQPLGLGLRCPSHCGQAESTVGYLFPIQKIFKYGVKKPNK